MIDYNFFKKKTILITGHTGFKGSWLSYWLYLLGANVIGYSLRPNKNQKLFQYLRLNDKIINIFGDIQELENLNKTIKKYKPSIVFHLAAQSIVGESYKNSKYTFLVNSIGTLNLLECLKKNKSVKSCVFVTSDKCYYNQELKRGYTENDILGGQDPYSGSKACAEIIFQTYYHSYFKNNINLSIATARAGNVIGGGDFTQYRLVPDVIKSIIENKNIKIKNPRSTRPWQHVLEPLNGYLRLSHFMFKNKKKLHGESFNFGPKPKSIKNVSYIVKKIIEISKIKKVKVLKINKKFTESNLLSLNIKKVKYYIGWEPKLNINQSLRLTIDWYKLMKKNPKMIQNFTKKQILNYMKI